MSLYLRKAISFGPLRLNLSKSGIGFSFGVTGARIGANKKNTYLHLGRHGIYYKKNLTNADIKTKELNLINKYTSDVDTIIDLENIQENNISANINKYLNKFKFSKLITLIFIFLFIGHSSYELFKVFSIPKQYFTNFTTQYYFYLLVGASSFLIVYFLISFIENNFYKIIIPAKKDEIETINNFITKSYSEIRKSKRIWAGQKLDSYYIERERVKIKILNPPFIKTKLKSICFSCNSHKLFLTPFGCFFLIKGANKIIQCDYENFNYTLNTVDFTETEKSYNDSNFIRWQYTYTKKDGSPDLRYKNNPTNPVVEYIYLYIYINNIEIIYIFSNSQIKEILEITLSGFSNVIKGVKYEQA